jgi:transposase InsO family protein
MRRYEREGMAGLEDKSRRPQRSPERTGRRMEQRILEVRDAHPAWGARKIQNQVEDGPAVSTVHAILKRNDRIVRGEQQPQRAWQRFEHEQPNQLWQMDHKGHFALGTDQRCHPLTILDDHSRYLVCLKGCIDERQETVRTVLTDVFRRYGLPDRMTMDNGPAWDRESALAAWLLRLGVGVSHSRPNHPQTQGKLERLHRSFKAEVLGQRMLQDFQHAQREFDDWRDVYNHQRPHQALAMKTPSSRYQGSPRSFPETLPAIEYAPDVEVRKVQQNGKVHFHGQVFKVGKAFVGYPIGLRATTTDGCWDVLFCSHQIGTADLRNRSVEMPQL